MFFFKHKKAFYKRKRVMIPLLVLVILVGVRMVLPTVLCASINEYLKTDFSPNLKIRIEEMDLAILRGVYTLKGVTGEFKNNNEQIVHARMMQISIPWGKVFSKSRPVVDCLVYEADINYSHELIPAIKLHVITVKARNKLKKKKLRFKIGRFEFINTQIRSSVFPSSLEKESVIITGIKTLWTNVTPTKKVPTLPFTLQGTVLDSGHLKITGEANISKKKVRWNLDGEITDFDLTKLNPFLIKKIPLTFTKGKLNIFAEATVDGSPMKGYLKPFITGLDVIRTKEKFLSAKHWFIEVITALANVTFKSDQTMATRIPFVIDHGFKMDKGVAISKAIEHGFKHELSRGIENSVGFNEVVSDKK